MDVTLSRPDIVYQINGTNQFVQAPIVTNGVVTTTAVIDNPYGGAFRSNRRPDVVPGVDPFLRTGDKRYFLNPAAFTFPQPGTVRQLRAIRAPRPGSEPARLHSAQEVRDRREAQSRVPGGVLQHLQSREFRQSAGGAGHRIGNRHQPDSAGPAVFVRHPPAGRSACSTRPLARTSGWARSGRSSYRYDSIFRCGGQVNGGCAAAGAQPRPCRHGPGL